jgi:hypothetical protein
VIDIKATKFNCKCGRCGTTFTLWSKVGRSDICDRCAGILIAFIFGTN